VRTFIASGHSRLLAALAVLIYMGAVPCAASKHAPGEKVISFSADVTVQTDTSIDVREEIIVHSEELFFKNGMVRYLPANMKGRRDKKFTAQSQDDFGLRIKILEVTEDGLPASYNQLYTPGYMQLRLGKSLAPLPVGDHTFVVRYRVEGAVNPLADSDELYWNVLGYYLDLPIDEAAVRVHFPDRVPPSEIHLQGYVDRLGVSKHLESDAQLEGNYSQDANGFRVTNLPTAQTLSVVATWPKGFVTPHRMGIFHSNRWLLAAPVVFFLYYLIVWMKLGPEPALGSVAVRYQPPDGLSPAAARYIRTTGSDARTLAAVIAQLAATECIEIELQNGAYAIRRLKPGANVIQALASEEARVLEMLFEGGPQIVLHPNKGDELNKYAAAIQGHLQSRLKGVYFTRHAGYIVLGMLMAYVTALGMALVAEGRDTSGLLFLTSWTFFCGSLLGVMFVSSLIPACKLALRGMGGGIQLLMGIAALGVFGFFFATLLKTMEKNVSPMYPVALVALIAVNVGWIPALKRMTAKGREALMQIEGFRMFLEKVEQDRMHRLNAKGEPPTASVEFLPYAIALEIRESWGDHLAGALYATTTSR
jgi:hypothetical protein